MSSTEFRQQLKDLSTRRNDISLAVKDSLSALETDLNVEVKTLIAELSSIYDASTGDDMNSLADIQRVITAIGKIEKKVGRMHNTFTSFRESSTNLFNSYPYLNGTPEGQSKRTKHTESDNQEMAEKFAHYTTPTNMPTGPAVLLPDGGKPMKTRGQVAKSIEFDNN